MTTDAEAPPPGAVFIVDCTPLVPAGSSARAIMDKEVSDATADSHLGKQISKPVSRILDRLCAGYRGRMTLVGVDGGAPLALCLLQHGTKSGTVCESCPSRPARSESSCCSRT